MKAIHLILATFSAIVALGTPGFQLGWTLIAVNNYVAYRLWKAGE